MASANRQPSVAIEQALLDDASAFSFAQVMSHLQRIVTTRGEDPSRKISVRPALSMALSRAQVVSVVKNEDAFYEVITNFMGLYGASSPLPNFYTDDLIALEQEDQTTTRRFLDVIHQRLYQLYAEAQEKYNSISAVVESQQQLFSQLLHTMVGSRDDSLKKLLPDANQLLSYIGILGSSQRSAQGLQTLLKDLLDGVDVEIEECAERLVQVPARHLSSIGATSCELGVNALIGDQIIDRTSKIVITLGPFSQQGFDQLVNDPVQWDTLVGFIRFYLNTPLEVDIKMNLIKTSAKTLLLGGEQWGQLGSDTWLFSDIDTLEDANEEFLVSTLSLG